MHCLTLANFLKLVDYIVLLILANLFTRKDRLLVDKLMLKLLDLDKAGEVGKVGF